MSRDMRLAVLIIICLMSQTSGSPNPSPGTEADPYNIVKTVTIWTNFTGTRSKNYLNSNFHFISTPFPILFWFSSPENPHIYSKIVTFEFKSKTPNPKSNVILESQEQHIAIDAKTNTATPRESSNCALGWKEFSHTRKCYKVLPQRNSWKNALSACKSAVSDPSATLASVPDQTTSDFLITLSPSSSVWVGGFKNSDGQWAWSDGSQMTFTNWGTGQPNNCCGGLQDYVVFYPFTQGKWNDLKESKRKMALCQYDRPTEIAVQGNWGSWSAWASCSESSGSRSRSRECDNPAPSYCGQECQGPRTETKVCNPDPCPGKPYLLSLDRYEFIC